MLVDAPVESTSIRNSFEDRYLISTAIEELSLCPLLLGLESIANGSWI
jgi:hypothetical protein